MPEGQISLACLLYRRHAKGGFFAIIVLFLCGDKLFLAAYICEVAFELSDERQPAGDILPLALNTLYMLSTTKGEDMRIKGVISNLDGMNVIKVASKKLPENFGFMVAHPCATVAPTKLADYRTHEDPPGINGTLTEGRINYDAFVLENKAKAIYYQAVTA